jgi:hypothetical protein
MTANESILELDATLKPLFGNVCWGVNCSDLLNFSLQLGEPNLRILREPYETKSRNKEVGEVKNQLRQRCLARTSLGVR